MIVMNLFVAISIEAYKKLAKYDRNSNLESTMLSQQETIEEKDAMVKLAFVYLKTINL